VEDIPRGTIVTRVQGSCNIDVVAVVTFIYSGITALEDHCLGSDAVLMGNYS
jgi:hypothetical protein